MGVRVYRSSALRKYGPLGMLAAVQLIVILVAPSTAPLPGAGADVAFGSPPAGTPGAGGPADAGTFTPGVTPGVTPGDSSGDGGGGALMPGAGPSGGTAGAGGPGGAVDTGGLNTSTAHCVDGRQFDPKFDYFAPPCVSGKPGGWQGPNGGATYRGVTADRIEIVHYIPDYGAEVNAILRAQGLFYDASNARIANAAYEKFLNERYQFYGRKVRITTFQGTCRTVPPDLPCLIAEMDKLVATHKPYAVHFNTTVCSACYAELARLKVVSVGGHGFSDEFRNQLKPYNYDDGMSSTRMAKSFAGWWCNQMTSKGGSGRTAIYAGAQNPLQDFREQPRVLGVFSTNDPDNETVVRNVLYPALERGCGEKVTHEYFYEQNVGTAASQSQAGAAAMNTPQNPATSVLCLCDPVAPQFGQNAFANNNYWPESLLASNQSMDVDPTGQTYMGAFACPQRNRGCNWDNAVGLGQSPNELPAEQKTGVKVFKAGSGGAAIPVQPPVLELFWNSYNLLGSVIQVTGPTLTPATMAAAAPRLGSRGGGTTGYPRRAFEGGELSWTRDVRLIYWSKTRTSPYNGVAGAYVTTGGRRFELGQFPRLPQPPAPTVDKRN